MEIDIEEFKVRLAKELAKGKSTDEITSFIHQEIRMTENMKAGLMEEMNEMNKDFLNEAAGRFDTYMFQLQEIEKKMHFKNLSLDQEVALNDKIMREEIAGEIDKLHKLDPAKFPDKINPNNNEK